MKKKGEINEEQNRRKKIEMDVRREVNSRTENLRRMGKRIMCALRNSSLYMDIYCDYLN